MVSSIMSRGPPLSIGHVQLHASVKEALNDLGMVMQGSQVDTCATLTVLQADVTALSRYMLTSSS